MNTTTAAKETDDAEARKAPLVQINCVRLNKAGSVYAQWDVRFPEGGTVEDLKDDGTIWRRVQDVLRPAIVRFDELRILAFDASWMAHVVVAHATGNALVLGVVAVTQLPEAQENLFQDEKYYVKFVGNGYTVFRKTDDQKMTNARPSADAAQTDLMNLYPKVV